MDDLGFDIGGILTDEEANKLFEEQETPKEAEPEVVENEHTEEETNTEPSEEVGVEDENGTDAVTSDNDGSSPNVYSSIASALKDDGIFPDLTDTDLTAVKTPEDFAGLFEKAITAKFDERQKRIDAALGVGVQPDTVRMYEQTLQYLDSINEEVLSSESDEGEALRKQIIYNDLMNRGYSHEKAMRELEKSFKSGSDVEDAKDALESMNDFYRKGYEAVQKQAAQQQQAAKEARQKQADDFKKLVLEDEVSLGDMKLDQSTKQRIFDAVANPIHKDKATGMLLTEVQKFQKEHPLEFWKQLGMWYVLTDGGKNMTGFTKAQVKAEKNKAIQELGRKINATSLNRDGSLKLATGSNGGSDPILSDGWKIGW